MRFLVTFVCLAVIATVVLAQTADVEPEAESLQLSVFEVDELGSVLAANSETGHENESDRVARQTRRRYGGGGGYGGYYGRGGGRRYYGRGRYYG